MQITGASFVAAACRAVRQVRPTPAKSERAQGQALSARGTGIRGSPEILGGPIQAAATAAHRCTYSVRQSNLVVAIGGGSSLWTECTVGHPQSRIAGASWSSGRQGLCPGSTLRHIRAVNDQP
jgi:hypothetical protein